MAYNGEPLYVLRHRGSGWLRSHNGAHSTPGLYRLSDARRIARSYNQWIIDALANGNTYANPENIYDIVPVSITVGVLALE